MYANEQLLEKWKPILEHPDAPAIDDTYRRGVTAQLLENTQAEFQKQGEALVESDSPSNVSGNVGKYDPVLVSLVRRSMPNLIAYDIAGVQPMSGPTGLIFALRPKYAGDGTQANFGNDAFYNEARSDFAGEGTHSLPLDPFDGNFDTGTGIATSAAEDLGTTDGTRFSEMGFEIDKITVSARTRALKAQYSVELSQDLKNIHGLDAETELANILSAEVMAEINREVVRTIYKVAKVGAQEDDLTAAGEFDLDLDSSGRWSVEKFKGLLFQIERDANQVAKETRRGKGTFVICSSDVASALSMAGVLDTGAALNGNKPLEVDDTGNTFAGYLNGRYRVYIDPYTTSNFYVIGYKGTSSYDAGIYYAPYVPLTMYKAVGEDSFQPRIGFKTRYGIVSNPFAEGTTAGNGALNANANVYYRKVRVRNLHGA